MSSLSRLQPEIQPANGAAGIRVETSLPKPQMRRFPRFNRSMLINLTTAKASQTGRTIDVSERGARVATRKPLDVGARVEVELYLHETDPFPIRLIGECRWSETENHESVSGIDLSLSRAHSLRILEAYIDQGRSA